MKENFRGFSLLEITIVLVIVGLLMGMASVSGNLHRSAQYGNVLSSFVLGWKESYNTYFDYTGFVVGDAAPATGLVNGAAGDDLCSSAMLDDFKDAGVEVPAGRARDVEYLEIYQAPDGIQKQVEVCFVHLVDWFVGPAVSDTQPANVMVLTGLSADLAMKIDAAIDGYADSGWGEFRNATDYNLGSSEAWPVLYDGDGDVVTVSAYFKMAN